MSQKKYEKEKYNCRKCGENWMPSHKCEDSSLCYYKIVDGKKIELKEDDEGITIPHNEDSDSEEPSLAAISCD